LRLVLFGNTGELLFLKASAISIHGNTGELLFLKAFAISILWQHWRIAIPENSVATYGQSALN
jgi:hypothetical protein